MDKTCKGEHQGHLCVMASKELFKEIKEITKNPGHICFNCGRVADNSANLCNPMPID
jgi:IMP cyclohydrolase